MTSRNEQRETCIKAMAAARANGLWPSFTREQQLSFLEDEKRVFDSLHGLARVTPVEATEDMFQAMYFVRRMRQAITNSFPRAALTDKETGIAGFFWRRLKSWMGLWPQRWPEGAPLVSGGVRWGTRLEDGTIVGAASPAQIRDTIIHEYKEMTRNDIVVERDPTDPDRIDVRIMSRAMDEFDINIAMEVGDLTNPPGKKP